MRRLRLVAVAVAVGLAAGPGAASPGRAEPAAVEQAGPALVGERSAMAQAVAQRRPVEVTSLTSERRRVLADPVTRTFRAELSAGPVRVRDASGRGWRPVDTTLARRPDGSVGPVAAVVDMSFSGGGAAPMVRVAQDGQWVALGWPGALPVPVLAGSTATYAAVLPGVDLVLEATAEGYSHYLVVRDAEAGRQPALRELAMTVATSAGLTVGSDADRLTVRDGAGREFYTGAPARMWDSAGKDASARAAVQGPSSARAGAPAAAVKAGAAKLDLVRERAAARSTEVRVRVTGRTLSLAPDQEFLADPRTVYPVIIDPPASVGRIWWIMMYSNGVRFVNSPTDYARVGYDGWSGNPKVARSFYQFDTSGFAGKQILRSVFAHKMTHSVQHACGGTYGPGVLLSITGGIDANSTWPGPGRIADISWNDNAHGHADYCPGYTHAEWDNTGGMALVAANGWGVTTFGLFSGNEADRNGWKRYNNDGGYPYIYVEYNSTPNGPAAQYTSAPSTGCTTGAGRPILPNDPPIGWTRLSDVDGGNLVAYYEIWNTGGSGAIWSGQTGFQGQGDYGLQFPGLADGTYSWRSRAGDGYTWGPFGGFCEYSVDGTAPGTAPTVTSTAFPKDAWAATGVGVAGSVTFDATVDTDVQRYEYAVNNGVFAMTADATALSGPVSVSVTPRAFGPQLLQVRSVDRAGNRGPLSTYKFKIPGAQPAGQWRLDEASGTTSADVTSGARPLTVPAGVTRTGGRYAAIDGTDRAILPTGTSATTATAPVRTDESFTAMAWVRLDTAPATAAAAVSQEGALNSAFALGYRNGKWAVSLNANDTATSAVTAVSDPGSPALGSWTHLAAVADRSANQVRLYVDGVKVATGAWTAWQAGTRLRVGQSRQNNALVDAFGGAVDEVRLYAGAMDDGQVYTAMYEPRPPQPPASPAPSVSPSKSPSPSPSPSPSMPSGLVGRWKLDEGSGLTAADSSGLGHPATLPASGVTWAPGRFAATDATDKALRFSSAGSALTTATVVSTTSSFTVSAWVRASAVPAGGDSVAVSLDGANCTRMALGIVGGDWGYYYTTTDTNTSPITWALGYGPAATANTWVHLAFVQDLSNNSTALFLNGVRYAWYLMSDVPWQSAGTLRIGGERTGSAPGSVRTSLDGDVDEVRVFNRALTPAEITAMFQQTRP